MKDHIALDSRSSRGTGDIGDVASPGVYALVLHVQREQSIAVGSLGSHTVEPGWYMYFGSAHGSGGLKSRVGRHQRANKKPHWHIDYLLPHAEILEIWCGFAPPETEHTWVAIILRQPGAATPIKGFGSSDCKSCESHLVKLSARPGDNVTNLVGVSKIIREPME